MNAENIVKLPAAELVELYNKAKVHDEILDFAGKAVLDVIAERKRQVEKGYTAQHDDEEEDAGVLAGAACAVAADAACQLHPYNGTGLLDNTYARLGWPDGWKWKEDRPAREGLIVAAALLIAELERLERTKATVEGIVAGYMGNINGPGCDPDMP